MTMHLRRRAATAVREPHPTDRQRLDSLYSADSLIITGLREQVSMQEAAMDEMLHGLVAGKGTLMGKRAVISWPDGTPYGLEGEQLLELFPLPAKSSVSYVIASAERCRERGL